MSASTAGAGVRERMAELDKQLTRTMDRLPLARQIEVAPAIGVLAVVLAGTAKAPPAQTTDAADDRWNALLDRIEPALERCGNAPGSAEFHRRVTELQEAVLIVDAELLDLAGGVEPEPDAPTRRMRLIARAQQTALTAAGARVDSQLRRLDGALARHRNNDEERGWRFEQQIEKAQGRIDEAAEAVGAVESELRKLLGPAAANTITEFFDRRERSERRRAEIWRLATVAFLVVGLVVVGHSLLAPRPALDLHAVLASVAFIGLVSGAVTFCRRESAAHHHRQRLLEDDHTRLAISLLYIVDLPPGQRATVFRDTFSRPVADPAVVPTQPTGEPPTSPLTVIENLLAQRVAPPGGAPSPNGGSGV
jgi:hypothetical protein